MRFVFTPSPRLAQGGLFPWHAGSVLTMPQRSSFRTSSAAAFCSRRRRSRPTCLIHGSFWRRGWAAGRSRSQERWRTPSSRRCGRDPAASTSISTRRSAVSPRSWPAGPRAAPIANQQFF